MDAGTLVLALVGGLVLLVVAVHNRLVRGRLRAREAWAGIDVQLKRRADLVPRLVETVRGYAGHERAVLEEVVRARGALERARGAGAPGAARAGAAHGELTRGLSRVAVLAEDYPELKASRHFLELQEELADTEDKIAWARQFYNRTVLAYNTRLRVFPNLLVARLFRFGPEQFFEAEADARAPVGVELAPGNG